MKVQRIIGSIFLGVAFVVLLFIVLNGKLISTVQAAPGAKALYVLDDGGADTSDCTDSQNPCKTIQYALDKAGPGDTIYVANKFSPATYIGTITIDKPVHLQGGWNVVETSSYLIWSRPSPCEASRTVIDAQRAGIAVVFTSSPYQPSIDCFTITGGDNAIGKGGGIYGYDVSPIITNNVITGNLGISDTLIVGYGGGIYLENAGAGTLISSNRIEGNVANYAGKGKGGGIYCKNSELEIRDNIINENVASLMGDFGEGGGIYLDNCSSALISGNTLEDNIGAHNHDGSGGGIFLEKTGNVTITQNTIQTNKATWAGSNGFGGGICINGGEDVIITQNDINANYGAYFAGVPSTANGYGGGIAISNSLQTKVTFNAIKGNIATRGTTAAMGSGGGIYEFQGSLFLENNNISYNYANNPTAPSYNSIGGGVYLEETTVSMDGNKIIGNKALGSIYAVGGGVRLNRCSAYTITNNVIAENSAGIKGSGIAIHGSTGRLINNTVARNLQGDGVGIFLQNSGSAELVNTIIVSNTVGISVETGTSAVMRATLWGSGSWANLTDWGGSGALARSVDLWGDPLFVDPG